MEKTILCIIRASTEKQETESQKKELVAYCKAKGFAEEQMAFIEVAGASARKLNKKYIQMLEDIKATILTNPTIKSVALWHLNRLGRVESKLHEMKEFFVTNKIQVYCKNPEFILLNDAGDESAAGGIAFSVYASMVKYETDEMFAKMKRGRERNKEQGIFYGGQIKYGLTLDDTKHFVINPEEASVVRLMYELYASGKYSFYKLVTELNSRGITKNGQKITYDMVQGILADKSYYNGKLPIIDKELFDKCAAIKANTIAIKRTKETRNINFAVGLLKCSCGQNYIASGDFYICYSKTYANRKHIQCECDSPVIRREVLDGLLWFVTKRLHQYFLMQKDSINIEEYRDRENILKLKVSTTEKELAAIEERTVTLEDDYYIEGSMTKAQFEKRLEGLKGKKQQTKSILDNLANELNEVAKMIQQLELPTNDKYLESLLLSDLNDEEVEDRRKIKEIMFQHIDNIRLNQYKEGKQKLVDITIASKGGLEFTFTYNIWLNSFRKGECCIFYDGRPLYEIDNHIIQLNKAVERDIEGKIGLPNLTNEELGRAAVNHIEREMIANTSKDEDDIRGRVFTDVVSSENNTPIKSNVVKKLIDGGYIDTDTTDKQLKGVWG